MPKTVVLPIKNKAIECLRAAGIGPLPLGVLPKTGMPSLLQGRTVEQTYSAVSSFEALCMQGPLEDAMAIAAQRIHQAAIQEIPTLWRTEDFLMGDKGTIAACLL